MASPIVRAPRRAYLRVLDLSEQRRSADEPTGPPAVSAVPPSESAMSVEGGSVMGVTPALEVLHRVFGYDEFRGEQAEIVEKFLFDRLACVYSLVNDKLVGRSVESFTIFEKAAASRRSRIGAFVFQCMFSSGRFM